MTSQSISSKNLMKVHKVTSWSVSGGRRGVRWFGDHPTEEVRAKDRAKAQDEVIRRASA